MNPVRSVRQWWRKRRNSFYSKLDLIFVARIALGVAAGIKLADLL